MARKSKPAEPIRNAPTKPGFYWAIWIKASPKTHEGDQFTLPEPDGWGIVYVFQNHIGPENHESLGVFVPGVRETQWLNNFVWGPGVQKPDLARYR